MRRFERGPIPALLVENATLWNSEWREKRKLTPPPAFTWPVREGRPANQHIIGPLKEQTQEHCSFCDAFPVCPPSIETIEHFRPKSEFPGKAFSWENLYYCCTYCQQKIGDFTEEVLCPDDPDYSFDAYFIWDYTKGTLEVNPAADAIRQKRALKTIEYFRFNIGHPMLRQREHRRRLRDAGLCIDDFAYRDYVSGICPYSS